MNDQNQAGGDAITIRDDKGKERMILPALPPLPDGAKLDVEIYGDFGRLVEALVSIDMPPVEKRSRNAHLGNQYASLDDIIATTRPVLRRAGLAIIQTNVASTNGVTVVTILGMKRDAETAAKAWRLFEVAVEMKNADVARAALDAWTRINESRTYVRGSLFLPVYLPVKGVSDEQAFGKAATYARRYGYQAMLSIAAEEDDDGHAVRDWRDARGGEQRRDPPRQETRRQEPPPKPTASYEDRLRAAKTIDEARGIAAEVNKDQTLSQDRRASISKLFTEMKAKLAPTGPTPPAQTDDLGGRM